MPSQSEEHRTSQPVEEGGAAGEDVRTRVSELLDNATEAPDDDFVREELLREEQSRSGAASIGQPADAASDDALSAEASAHSADGGEPAAVEEASEAPASRVDAQGGDAVSPEDSADLSDAASKKAVAPEDAAAGQVEVFSELDERTASAETMAEQVAEDVSETQVAVAKEPAEQEYAGEDGDQISPSTVRIRGRPGGVLVEIEDEGDWKEILRLLEQRLDAAEGFFRGGKAVVEVGPRDVYEDELRQARDMLARHDMTLAVVRSTSDLTLQSSLLLGLSTSSQTEKPVEADREMAPVVPITQPKSPYFVHNGTLRSGQILRKAESIVIVGDVNPGAKVISGGDVMVWGRLRGLAYAGASGNKSALVAAIEFSPTQLRIASVTAVPPDAPKSRGLRFWKKSEPDKRPEVAHIANGRIVVEPWDDSRPGRPKVARK